MPDDDEPTKLERLLSERGFLEVSDPVISTRAKVYELANDLKLMHRFEVASLNQALATLENIASLPQKLKPWCLLRINREYQDADSQDSVVSMGAMPIGPVLVFCFTDEVDAIYAQLCRG